MRGHATSLPPIKYIAFGVLIIAAGAVAIVMQPQARAHAGASPSSVSACTQAAVIAAESNVPSEADNVAVPAGEPAVVATVNGIPITASQFEEQVAETQQGNQKTLSTLPANAPATIRADVTQSAAQLRQSTLHQMIVSILWLEAGKHAGLVPTASQVHAFMSQQLQTTSTLAPADPARVTFEAFMCFHGLTQQTFLSNANLTASYQNNLTITAARQQFLSHLTPAQAQNPSTAILAHEQDLWNAATIQVNITY